MDKLPHDSEERFAIRTENSLTNKYDGTHGVA
jgi:hypothetical protein